MKQNTSESATELRPPCQNLRSKEMYHQSPGEEEDEYSSGAYWCVMTQEVFGPDGQPTGRRVCCQGRGCYVG